MEKLKKIKQKLIKEAIIKASLSAANILFIFMFVYSLFSLFAENFNYLMFIIISLVVFVLSTVFLFVIKFKPTLKYIAKRVDELGLEERVITMIQFQNEIDFMYQRQRNDAIENIKQLNEKLIHVTVSFPLIFVTAVTFVLGAGVTTVSILSNRNYISGVNAIVRKITDEFEETYEVNYKIACLVPDASGTYYKLVFDEGGELIGDTDQVVIKGENGTEIYAQPFEGYAFYQWSDENEDPCRIDETIQENITITAYFIQIEESENGQPGDGEGEPSDGEPSDGEPSEDGDSNNDSNNPSDQPGDGAGGKYEEKNQVLDGETYYGDAYDNAKSDTMEKTSKNGEMPTDVKKIISDYFDSIKKSGSN